MMDRYKGDKRPERSHPVYLRQQTLARKNALRLKGQTISTISVFPLNKNTLKSVFFSVDFYVVFYAQKYVIFRTVYIYLIAVGCRRDMKA